METFKAKELPKRGTNTYLAIIVRAYLDVLALPRETWSETLERILPVVLAQRENDPCFKDALEHPAIGRLSRE